MGCCQSTQADSDNENIERRFLPIATPVTNEIRVTPLHDALAENQRIDKPSAINLIKLFENQNTVPFIYRYRRDLFNGDITPQKLSDIRNAYTNIVDLRKRADAIISKLEQENNNSLEDDARERILAAKTLKELEYLHSIYKKSLPLSNLEDYVTQLLSNTKDERIPIIRIVNKNRPDLNTVDKVKEALCKILSLEFSRIPAVVDELKRLQKTCSILLKCTKIDGANTDDATSVSSVTKRKDSSKYEMYFDFQRDIRIIKPYQVLAINRGEKFKFLSVEVILPASIESGIKSYMRRNTPACTNKVQLDLLNMSIERSYEQYLKPFLCRQIRADLTEEARQRATEVFASNLKQLLLTPPLKGEPILGIDPGFKNGCKCALISGTGNVLDVGVVYPHTKRGDTNMSGNKVANMLAKHNCTIIALGNGNGARETEAWLTKLLGNGTLDAGRVRYTLVPEQGVSVYSCSVEAQEEFPKYDVKLISAVSIARRLNDPLSEYVKVEPHHLGIGMYQLDLKENVLHKSLSEVVTECVSNVGVDINTAGASLLKYVAGLNAKCAKGIIQHRHANGFFHTRKDLLKVKTVGQNEFSQCAGFIRIEPKSVGGKVANMLDCTWVHPESYPLATQIIARCNLRVEDVGKPEFISKITIRAQNYANQAWRNEFNIPPKRLQTVLEALQRQFLQDCRPEFDQKIFKSHITQIEDFFIGEIVTGVVNNVVDFGVFVDIGFRFNGLIPSSKLNRLRVKVGDRVSTTVIETDLPRKRITLRLDEVL